MNRLVTSLLTGPDGLGTRLREIRERAGLSGKQFAEAVGWEPTRVSKLELGRQMPTTADLSAYVETTNYDALMLDALINQLAEVRSQRFTFAQRGEAGQAAIQKSYSDLIAEASVLRDFETAWVPGLLQVPEYARHVLVESQRLHEFEIDDVDAAVAERVQRQQQLYDTSKRFEMLITEPVLRWRVAPPAVLRAQLDGLLAAMDLPNVRFGIVPLDAELSWTPQQSFAMFDDVAIVEGFVGETTYEGDEAARFARVMELMWSEAVEGDEARRLIRSAAEALNP